MSRSETLARDGAIEAEVGRDLPELSVGIDTVHVFMFSAVTWNRHLIHFDADQAGREGHSSVLAQRALLGNYFARQVTTWLGDRGDLATLSWKVVASSVPGDTLTCRAVITDRTEGTVALDLTMTNQDGTTVATGGATARLRGSGE